MRDALPLASWQGAARWIRDYPGGAALSERFKSAFRVALAMVITYGISLAMDWDKAFWAALSVIFCSLATAGESVNASLDRIAGTGIAALLALLVVAAFPQDRWLFLLSLSAIIAVCSYQMTGGSLRNAVWFNAGFNLPIIAILGETSGTLGPTTFDMAVLRVQQTALGAIVYSLVAVLVWPRRGDEDFVRTVRGICETQQQLFRGYIDLLTRGSVTSDLQKSMAEVASELPTLGARLEGAVYDNPDLGLVAGAWARLLRDVRALHDAFDRWGSGFEELEGLDLQRHMPGLGAFIAGVDECFQGMNQPLSGKPAPPPRSLELALDRQSLVELSHFQRAAVVACRDRLLAIRDLAASLFESARRIRAGEPVPAEEPRVHSPTEPWTIDLDRLGTTIRQTTALWLVFLTVIYVEAVPIVVATVALTNAFSMVLGKLPHAPATMLYKPVIQGGLFGGAFYVLVLPHLSGFWAFGCFLFAAIFAVAYIFHEERATLVRGLWMTMLVLIMGADNQQIFSFLAFANWFLAGMLFVTFMVIAWRFPISFRPQDRLRAQLRRCWQSAAFLLKDLGGAGADDSLYRWKRTFHRRQLTALPPRLQVWASALPAAAVEGADRQHLQALVRSLQLISHRMQELQQTHSAAAGPGRLGPVRSSGEDLRMSIAAFMDQLAQDPAEFDGGVCLETVDHVERALQSLVQDLLRRAELTLEEGQRAYRLLGASRGLLSAFRAAVNAQEKIDWPRLNETRL